MAKYLKKGTTNIQNTTQKGNFSIGDSSSGDLGPTERTGFYNGLEVPTNGYVIYYNRENGGPVGHVASNNEQAMFFLKSFGATGSTINEMLSWASNQNDYYVDQAINNLVLHLDATNLNSYSGTGNTWTDLSGNSNNATKYNTPNFLNLGNSSNFFFNNVNKTTYSTQGLTIDGFTFSKNPNIPQTSSFTFEAFVYINALYNGEVIIGNSVDTTGYRWGIHGDGSMYMLIGDNSNYSELTLGAGQITTNSWLHLVGVFDRTNELGGGIKAYAYVNKTLIGSQTIVAAPNLPLTTPGIVKTPCCNAFNGYINIIKIYNKALSSAEVTQNYNSQNIISYNPIPTPTPLPTDTPTPTPLPTSTPTPTVTGVTGTTIVTTNLKVNLDASNSSSYPGTGTTWTDISGNNYTSSLVNGPTFNSANGGSIKLDGSNDYITLPSSSVMNFNADFTVEITFKHPASGNVLLMAGLANSHFQIRANPTNVSLTLSDIVELGNFGSSTAISRNKIYVLTITMNKSLNTCYCYLDGVYKSSLNIGSRTFSSASPVLGKHLCCYEIYNGSYYGFKFYDRKLTDSEVQQNFDSVKTKLGL